MTTADQFQKQGVYSNYRQINEYPISVGTDSTNDNASGSLCFVTYYKKGSLVPLALPDARTITIPPYSQAVYLKLENRTGTDIPSTFSFFANAPFGASARTPVIVRNQGVPSRSAVSMSFTSTGWPDYCLPDIRNKFTSTIIFNFSGFPAAIGFTPLYYVLGLINAKEYNVQGQ